MKLDAKALANTFAIIDLIGHTLFHIWVAIAPQSYERLMQLFVAGLRLKVDSALELAPANLLLSTLLEASVFWILGYSVANLYNHLSKK